MTLLCIPLHTVASFVVFFLGGNVSLPCLLMCFVVLLFFFQISFMLNRQPLLNIHGHVLT